MYNFQKKILQSNLYKKMAIRRLRNRKFIIIMISTLLISGLCLSNFLTTDDFNILHLYLYKINEFLLPYYHTVEQPDEIDYYNNVDTSRNLTNLNFLCLIPEIKFDNKLAMRYLNKDLNALNKTFYICDNSDKEIDLVFINDWTLFDFDSKILNKSLFQALKEQNLLDTEPLEYKYVEYYSLKLDVDGFNKKFGQNINDIRCFAQQFDKKLDESENEEILVMIGDERGFSKSSNFTLYFDSFGFYYVSCYKKIVFGSLKNYEYVYNVYPRDMSLLRRSREEFIKFENEKRKLFNETPEVIKFVDDGEPVKIVKKMNVMILAFDSVSLNHFKRIFPLTFDYLKNKLENTNVYDSVSSVGHNTYPNVLALCAGIVEAGVGGANVSSERDLYENIDGTFFDHYPFLWKEFEKLGYVTSYQVNFIFLFFSWN
jgi:hypothetical protein